METIGQRVWRLRKARRLTQVQLARLVPGMTASAISQLENGQTVGLKAENALSLAKGLGVTPQEILTGRPPPGSAQDAPTHAEDQRDDDTTHPEAMDTTELMAIWRRLPASIRGHYIERLREVDNAYAILAKHEVPTTFADVNGRLPSAPRDEETANIAGQKLKKRKKR